MNGKAPLFFGTLLWLSNPIFSGCSPSSSDPEWQFGETELQAMVDDINSQVWEYEHQGQQLAIHFALNPVEMELEEASLNPVHRQATPVFIASAHACGTTTFFASAQACIDMAMMQIEGTVQIIDVQSQEILIDHVAVQGEFNTSSTVLDSGSLSLWNDDGLYVSLSDYDGLEGLNFQFDTVEW